jgi:hypothetical protein
MECRPGVRANDDWRRWGRTPTAELEKKRRSGACIAEATFQRLTQIIACSGTLAEKLPSTSFPLDHVMLDKPQRDRSTFVRFVQPHRSLEPATVLRKLRPLFDAVWLWRFRAPALLAILAALWFFGVPFVFGRVVYVDLVVRAEFVHSVVASGHVEAPFRVNIGSQITGVVVDVPVEEGQPVKAGEILILLDDREARAAVVQAEGAVAQAEARLRQLHELTLPSAEEALVQVAGNAAECPKHLRSCSRASR